MPVIVAQMWTEIESGWGQRPDGYTLHLSVEACLAHAKRHTDWLHDHYKGKLPPEYSFADGRPIAVDVDHTTYRTISKGKEQWVWVQYLPGHPNFKLSTPV